VTPTAKPAWDDFGNVVAMPPPDAKVCYCYIVTLFDRFFLFGFGFYFPGCFFGLVWFALLLCLIV
jgi:hypothetical protein